jgi:PEP-CTERM motif
MKKYVVHSGTIAVWSLAILSLSIPADAGVVIYSGFDTGAESNQPRPNSDATAKSFDAAAALLGPKTLVDFENAPLGEFTNLTIAPGVTISGADINSNPQTIRDAPLNPSKTLDIGYNTTPGGSHFVSLYGGTLTFTFAQGIQAFGAYLTGVQLDSEVLTFNDGTSQTIPIPNPDTGAMFLGFTDVGKSITSITLNVQVGVKGDLVGVDDVRWVPAGAHVVPEPSALSLIAVGLAGIAAAARRRKLAA